AGRTAMFLYTLFTLAVLHKWPALRNLDRALLVWGLAYSALDVCVSSTRPTDYMGHFILEVLLVVLFYTVLPAPLPYQAAPGLLVSAGGVALFAAVKTPGEGLTGMALTVAYLLANGLGGLSSWELQRWKRQQFAALHREAALRADLEKALGEVRTLRGM